MIPREVRILMTKEWRHLLRSRGAMLTAMLLPVFIMLIVPGLQMLAFSVSPDFDNTPLTELPLPSGFEFPDDLPLPSDVEIPPGAQLPPGVNLPPGMAAITDDPKAILRVLLLPLFITLGGLMLPSITAVYTVIAERENRTIELLIALPVRVGQILLAKLLVILLLSSAVTLTLFLIDAILILVLGIGSIGYVLSLLLVLLGALAYSTASALLLSLLARDFRTANNLSGALLVPTIFICVGVLLLTPGGPFQLPLLALMFGLATALSLTVALRVVTFERLLR